MQWCIAAASLFFSAQSMLIDHSPASPEFRIGRCVVLGVTKWVASPRNAVVFAPAGTAPLANRDVPEDAVAQLANGQAGQGRQPTNGHYEIASGHHDVPQSP